MDARSAIIEALAADPTTTARELVALTGVSRQRVYQLLKTADLRAGRTVFTPKPPKSRMQVRGPTSGISHTNAGTVGDLLAAADLITRGWFVFFPLVRTARCDLLVLSSKGLRTRRIEVRSGHRVNNGGLSYNKKPSDVWDHYAVVLHDEPIVFLPDIETGVDP